MDLPFKPALPNASASHSVTSTSSAVVLNASVHDAGPTAVYIVNVGSNEAFISWGDSTTVAVATTGLSIPAGFAGTITLPDRVPSSSGDKLVTHIAAICASGATTTLRYYLGMGL